MFWILSFNYQQLALKIQRVAQKKPPSEVSRLFNVLYYGGLLLVVVLEILDCLAYKLTTYPYKAAEIIYYILTGFLALSVGVLFDALRKMHNVFKKY